MDVSATLLNGEKVRIIDVTMNGSTVYTTYITSAAEEVRVRKTNMSLGEEYVSLATSATVN